MLQKNDASSIGTEILIIDKNGTKYWKLKRRFKLRCWDGNLWTGDLYIAIYKMDLVEKNN